MNGWTAALLAAGLFLVVYAIILLTRRKDDGGKDMRLGFGFVLVATVIWGLAFGRLLDDFWLGMQLGVSLALLLPAVGMLVRPRKRGVLTAMLLLMVAVGMGVPATGKLWNRLTDAASHDSVDAIEDALARVSRQVEESAGQLESLEDDRATVTRELRAFGSDTLAEVEGDPQAALRLDELAEIDRLQDALAAHLVLLREKREQLEVGLRRARRLDDAQDAAGDDLIGIDVDAIMREIEASRRPTRAVTVEEHVERRQKQELLEDVMR